MFKKLGNLAKRIAVVVKRPRALFVLETSLKSAGFTLYKPIDPSEKVVELGAEVWVLMSDPTNSGFQEKKSILEIQAITDAVANSYGLTSIGRGPMFVENAVSITACGFRYSV